MSDIGWTRGFAIRRMDNGKLYLGEEAGGVWWGLEKDGCVFRDAADAAEVAEFLAEKSGAKVEVLAAKLELGETRLR